MDGRGERNDRVQLEEIDAFLDEIGFDPERSVLTRRQAQVLAPRDRGESQAAIAELETALAKAIEKYGTRALAATLPGGVPTVTRGEVERGTGEVVRRGDADRTR